MLRILVPSAALQRPLRPTLATPNMHLLYPCDPFDKKKPDEAYEEEFSAAQSAGFTCFLFSSEDFELGEFKPRPANAFEGEILYRGWMLTPTRYAQLQEAIESKGATVVVTAENYRRCHYLPEWYDQCKDVTPENDRAVERRRLCVFALCDRLDRLLRQRLRQITHHFARVYRPERG